MKVITLIVVLIAAVDAKAATGTECKVSQWSPWHVVANPDLTDPGLSFPDDGEQTGKGRQNRLEMMRMKTEHREQIRQCKKSGSCGVMYDPRPSEGRVDCTNNMANDLECDLIDQLSFVNITDLTFDPAIDPSPHGTDLWGWVDPIDGKEYAIMGMNVGVSFVDVTNPESPVVLGHLPTHGTLASLWRDMKVIGNYAYVVSEDPGHGIQVFDLTRLRDVPGAPVMFTEDGYYDQVGNCHNIVANEETGFLYAVGCTGGAYPNLCLGGLHAVNTNTDPVNPSYAGCFGGDGYTHDAQCVIYRGPDVRYAGREICFTYNEDALTVVDVTDKANMMLIAKRIYLDNYYTHQGWLSEDHSIVVCDDELDEYYTVNKNTRTLVWDVRDLENPILVSEYIAAFEAIDHNQYVLGDYVFQSNYFAGLRMLLLDQVDMTLQEVAFFDNVPGVNIVEFGGTWSVYPYFPSGNVVVTNTETGLFTVRPRWATIQDKVNKIKQTNIEMSRYRVVLEAADDRFCPKLTDTKYV